MTEVGTMNDIERNVKTEKVELLRKQLSEAIDNALNKQLQSKYIINKDENIQESQLLRLLCDDWNMRWKTCSYKMNNHYGYNLSFDDIKAIIRRKGIINEGTRKCVYKWATELSTLFINALSEGTAEAFEKFKKHRNKDIQCYDGSRLKVQDRIGIIMLFHVNQPLGSKNVFYRLNQLSNYSCKSLLLNFMDILSAYCGAGLSGNKTSIIKLSLEQSKRRVEELENELARVNMMLSDLQEEFDSRIQENQSEAIASVFSRLNSEKYGNLLDELLNINKGIMTVRKAGFQLPPEISGLFIAIQKMLQFVKDSGVNPLMKPGLRKKVKMADIEGCDYTGTPFTDNEEEKEIVVLTPGWIITEDGIKISRTKVKEVAENEN
jgi:hypothetical protein